MNIIHPRRYVPKVSYTREFEYPDAVGCGFSFPCDSRGKVRTPTNPAAKSNLAKCRSGEFGVIDKGVERHDNSYWLDAIGECVVCGRRVTLEGFTNTCDGCGADYNSGGMLLASRSQWGDETGETLADILSIR